MTGSGSAIALEPECYALMSSAPLRSVQNRLPQGLLSRGASAPLVAQTRIVTLKTRQNPRVAAPRPAHHGQPGRPTARVNRGRVN